MLITTKTDIERIEKLPVFFIISRGRSGSTLLRTLLDAHPNIIIPFQSRAIMFLYYKYESVKKWDNELLLSFYDDLLAMPKIKHLNFNPEKLKQDLLAAVQVSAYKISFGLLCKIVFLHFNSVFEKKGIHIIGHRSQYFYFLNKLLNLFPNAKFILLTRDYRDNILSYFKVDFEPKVLAWLAYRWKYLNKSVVSFKKQHPAAVYHLRYEDLVSNPEYYMRETSQFLGIDYESSMLTSYSQVTEYKNILPAVEIGRHTTLFSGTINKDKANVWKKEMSSSNVMLADFVVGSFAEEMGYKRASTNKNVSLYLVAASAIVHGWLLHTKRKIYKEAPIFRMLGFYAFCRKYFMEFRI